MYNLYYPRHFLFAARVILNLIRDAKHTFAQRNAQQFTEPKLFGLEVTFHYWNAILRMHFQCSRKKYVLQKLFCLLAKAFVTYLFPSSLLYLDFSSNTWNFYMHRVLWSLVNSDRLQWTSNLAQSIYLFALLFVYWYHVEKGGEVSKWLI